MKIIRVECPEQMKIAHEIRIDTDEPQSVDLDKILAKVLAYTKHWCNRPVIITDKEIVILTNEMLRQRLETTTTFRAIFMESH